MLRPIESPRGWVQPVVEVVTVGLPFCAFKVLTGLMAMGTPLAPVGYLLLALGGVDLALNAANLGSLLTVRRRIGAVCVTDAAVARLPGLGMAGDQELALALDMFLSFTLVAVVIGFGLLLRLVGARP